MSGILDLLNSPIGKTLVNGAASQMGMDSNKAGGALQSALPLILGAMKNNVSSPEGASGLLGALMNEKHGGGILDNLGSILGGNSIDDDVMQDGGKILGHVFGGKQENVAAAISKSNGIDLSQAMNILKVAAPIVMGFLGKQARTQGVQDTNGVNNLLGGLLGGQSQQSQSMITRLLDSDGDGSVIDDVAGMLMGAAGGNKSSGGGILGTLMGMFGKK